MASIANYETLEGIVSTAFWRTPEVLQALQDIGRFVRSKNSDVSNFQMLYYENIDWRHTSQHHSKMDYDFILSGQKPPLISSSVHSNYKSLLHCRWDTNLEQRPE